MLEAILWGLVQGLTEFLPISSSGHLVLVPAFLDMAPPDLATSAVLHLGTLAAVLVYYRLDLRKMVRFRTDREARHLVSLIAIGTVPAVIGVVAESRIEAFQEDPGAVSWALVATGVVLFASGFFATTHRRVEEATWKDAALIGIAQAFALIPGISRSGMTITAGLGRKLDRVEAARFSFLLGIPAIAGAGLKESLSLLDSGGVAATTWLAVVVAALSGYAAIALLIRMLGRVGLRPFALYAVVVGLIGVVAL